MKENVIPFPTSFANLFVQLKVYLELAECVLWVVLISSTKQRYSILKNNDLTCETSTKACVRAKFLTFSIKQFLSWKQGGCYFS